MRRRVAGLLALALGLTMVAGAPAVAAAAEEPGLATADEMRFRDDFALRRDTEYVQELHRRAGRAADSAQARAVGLDLTYGVPLTLDEAAEIGRRQRVVDNYGRAVRTELRKLGQTEPDLVLDHKLGGVIRVRTGDDPAAVRAQLLSTGIADKDLVVERTARPLDRLLQVQSGLWARRAEVPGLVSIGVDHDAQRLVVGVTGDPEQARGVLGTMAPADYLSVEHVADQGFTGSTAGDPNPYHGGYKITNASTGASCTLGFPAYGPGSNYYWITAGHCANLNVRICQPYCDGSGRQGTVVKNAYQASSTPLADAAAIGTYATYTHSGIAINSGGVGIRNMVYWEGWAGDVVGEADCMAGYASNYRCGTLKDKSLDTSFNGKSFIYMRRVSYASIPGDSGGPHFYGTTIHGIQSGNHTNLAGTFAFYSHVDDVLRSLGIYYVDTAP
jgi:hypothetical protein